MYRGRCTLVEVKKVDKKISYKKLNFIKSNKYHLKYVTQLTVNNKYYRYLNYIFEKENGPIRQQDYRDVFTAVSSTPKGLDVLIDFLVENLNEITKKLIDGDDIAIFIYSTCASKAALDSEIDKVINKRKNIIKNLKILISINLLNLS